MSVITKPSLRTAALVVSLSVSLWSLALAPRAEARETPLVERRLARVQELLSGAVPTVSYTAARVEAFRIYSRLPEDVRERHPYFLQQPTAQDCLASATYPILSCYRNDGERYKAEAILHYAEEAWRWEVEEFGFTAPIRGVPGQTEKGVVFYLGDTRSMGAAGYTTPVDYDPSTPQTDCISYIVMDEYEEPGPNMAHTVRHEFNHACQLASDCLETVAAMEGTAVWVETAINGQDDPFYLFAVRAFQSQPERSIGWGPQMDMYPYGVSLFFRYVQEHLGGGDPRFVAQVWNQSTQPNLMDQGAFDLNEPDLLDTITDMVADRDMDLETVIRDFGEWRYFLGTQDDGAHFEGGRIYRGAEPRVTAGFYLDRAVGEAKVFQMELDPLGYGYLVMRNMAFVEHGKLLVELTLERPEERSRTLLELWGIGGATEPAVWAGNPGDQPGEMSLAVDLAEFQGATKGVIMVANLPDGVDWDEMWEAAPITVAVEAVPGVEVLSMTPESVQPGTTTLTIHGSWFGGRTRVSAEGVPGVELGEPRLLDEGDLEVELTVPRESNAGVVTVRVWNDDGTDTPATWSGEVEVILPAAAVIDGVDPRELVAGESADVVVRGENLDDGVDFEFDCPGLRVVSVDVDAKDQVTLHLEVPEDLEGTCTLEARDRYGRETVMPAAVSVAGPTPRPAADADATGGDGGCSCSTGQAPRYSGMLPLRAVIGLLTSLRRG